MAVRRLDCTTLGLGFLVGAGEGNRTLMTSLEGCDWTLLDQRSCRSRARCGPREYPSLTVPSGTYRARRSSLGYEYHDIHPRGLGSSRDVSMTCAYDRRLLPGLTWSSLSRSASLANPLACQALGSTVCISGRTQPKPDEYARGAPRGASGRRASATWR
jgi:hypothetical protein